MIFKYLIMFVSTRLKKEMKKSKKYKIKTLLFFLQCTSTAVRLLNPRAFSKKKKNFSNDHKPIFFLMDKFEIK